jgi:hypothetical protein
LTIEERETNERNELNNVETKTEMDINETEENDYYLLNEMNQHQKEDNEVDFEELEYYSEAASESQDSKITRQLSTAGFQIFVHHYFSMEWLREYLLKLKVYDLVGTSEEDAEGDKDEEDDYYDDYYQDSGSEEETVGRAQMYEDLTFLIRSATEWFPTAQILSNIMNLLHGVRWTGGILARNFNIDSIYFTMEIAMKASNSPEPLSSLWRKVLSVRPYQLSKYDYYQNAKEAEITNNNYSYQRDFEKTLEKTSKTTPLDLWTGAEHTVRRFIEGNKSFEDRLKYYQYLSIRERNQGDCEISRFWEEIVTHEREENEEEADRVLVIVWCLQKGRDSPIAGKIWNITANHVITNGLSGSKNNSFILTGVKLALDVEKLYRRCNEMELKVISFDDGEEDSGITQLKDVTMESVQQLRSVLSEKLAIVTAENLMEMSKDIIACRKSFSCLDRHFTAFPPTIIHRDNLLTTFNEYPDVLALVESRFTWYVDDLVNCFGLLLSVYESSSDDSSQVEQIKREFPSLDGYPDFFRELPFQEDLELYLIKRKTNTSSSFLFGKVVTVILEILSSRQPVHWLSQGGYQALFQERIRPLILHVDSPVRSELKNSVVDVYLEFLTLNILSLRKLKRKDEKPEWNFVSKRILPLFKSLEEAELAEKELSFLQSALNQLRNSKWTNYNENFKLSVYKIFFLFLDKEFSHQRDQHYEFLSESLHFFLKGNTFHAYLVLLKIFLTPETFHSHYEQLYQSSPDSLNPSMVSRLIHRYDWIIDRTWFGCDRTEDFRKRLECLLYASRAVVMNSQVLLNQWDILAEHWNTKIFEAVHPILFKITGMRDLNKKRNV